MLSVWNPLCTLVELLGVCVWGGGVYPIHTCIIKSYHPTRPRTMSPPPGSFPDLPAKDTLQSTLKQFYSSSTFLPGPCFTLPSPEFLSYSLMCPHES